MRILFSLTYYTPYISGLTLYVKRLAEALASEGYLVSVISNQYQKDLREKEMISKVKVVRAKPLFRISKGFISLDWLLKSLRLVNTHEVVLVNLPQLEGIIPALLGRLFRKKVISIYHCEVVLPYSPFNLLVGKILDFSNYITLLLSERVITYTQDFAKSSKILSRFSSKLQYIYPPIKKPKIDKRVQKIIKRKIGSRPNFVIGLAARLAAEKGIEYLLEAIPIISSKLKAQSSKLQLKTKNYKTVGAKDTSDGGPDLIGDSSCRRQSLWRRTAEVEESENIFKIVIVGPLEPVGEKTYKDKIMQLVEKYKDYVVFLGELKEEEMGSFYSLIDVLVLPSVNSTEAFGMVQVEAMMMGVPVVASDLPGVRIPIKKTGMGILVPPRENQKLAEEIVEVLLNKKKYIKNKELLEKEFSFRKTIEFYEKLFG